ncbi:MAG: leucine-rich repeat domain-containing protein [Prevotella sp.]|nr:leucine-rich repeat domain-containing protein [Prevotella sp.]
MEQQNDNTQQPLIPDGTTYIDENAFSTRTDFTEVIIPDSVTCIGKEAFSECGSLKKVTIGNNVTTIEEAAFSNCHKLKDVSIGRKVTYIGAKAFSDCKGLTKIVMPDSVTTIGKHAFSDCVGLGEIIISKNVTTIGEYAFSGCVGLEKITIPNNVVTIEKSAFEGCKGLREVIIEDSEEHLKIVQTSFSDCPIASLYMGRSISAYKDNPYERVAPEDRYSPFKNTTTLTTLTIGKNKIYPGEKFENCFRLLTINSMSTEPPFISLNCNPGFRRGACVLNVPIGCKEAYSQAAYWKDFAKINEVDFSKKESTNNDYECVESDNDESTIVIKGDKVRLIIRNQDDEQLERFDVNGEKKLNIPLAKVIIYKKDNDS